MKELSVWGIERDAIGWVQKHAEDLLAPLRNTGRIDYFEARQFAQKAYRAGFADAMLGMGVWPIERDARSFKEKKGDLKNDE